MKQHFLLGLAALLLMLLIPLVSLRGGTEEKSPPEPSAARQEKTAAAQVSQAAAPVDKEQPAVPVVRASTGKTQAVPLREYLVGCVAAEMEASCHMEALKAQAVASHTYARYRLEVGGKAALSDSGKSDQGFLDQAQRRQRWGKDFELYEAKVERAVDAVFGQAITRDGKPILAAYCAVSGGKTESALNYWGDDLPYLQSVDSPGDKLSPDYSRIATLPADEVKKALEKAGAKPGKDPSKWFGTPARSEAGAVLELDAGGKTFSGRALREALNLRSANFTIIYKNDAFEITCLGYGHGVGMSQHGADFMARQGSDYKEILSHYYADCEIG